MLQMFQNTRHSGRVLQRARPEKEKPHVFGAVLLSSTFFWENKTKQNNKQPNKKLCGWWRPYVVPEAHPKWICGMFPQQSDMVEENFLACSLEWFSVQFAPSCDGQDGWTAQLAFFYSCWLPFHTSSGVFNAGTAKHPLLIPDRYLVWAWLCFRSRNEKLLFENVGFCAIISRSCFHVYRKGYFPYKREAVSAELSPQPMPFFDLMSW